MPFTPEEKKQRQREAVQRWRANNPDRVKELGREHDKKRSEKKIAQVMEWRKNNPEKYAVNHARHREKFRDLINERQRKHRFKRLYGIRFEDIPHILIKQGGCAACKTQEPDSRGWAVDHCHETNEYRGILCHPCNIALGLVGDSVERLKQLINYLEG